MSNTAFDEEMFRSTILDTEGAGCFLVISTRRPRIYPVLATLVVVVVGGTTTEQGFILFATEQGSTSRQLTQRVVYRPWLHFLTCHKEPLQFVLDSRKVLEVFVNDRTIYVLASAEEQVVKVED